MPFFGLIQMPRNEHLLRHFADLIDGMRVLDKPLFQFGTCLGNEFRKGNVGRALLENGACQKNKDGSLVLSFTGYFGAVRTVP